jgi:amidase
MLTMKQVDLAQYIAGLVTVPTGVKNLVDLIAFNIKHADQELIPPYYTDQSRPVYLDNCGSMIFS